jgi:hypothetical protein
LISGDGKSGTPEGMTASDSATSADTWWEVHRFRQFDQNRLQIMLGANSNRAHGG